MRSYGFPKRMLWRGWVVCVLVLMVRTPLAWAQFGGTVVFDRACSLGSSIQLQQETAAVKLWRRNFNTPSKTPPAAEGLWRSIRGSSRISATSSPSSRVFRTRFLI